MPRKARIDAPGALHHIIVRGIERRTIFIDDTDRDGFLDRLGSNLLKTGTACYAWALIPNHFHLLLRTGHAPIADLMRRLLTGYAVTFNHRHRRSGVLFQNRYKSILCQEEPYFLELVRYIHLNPLRAGLVADFKALGRYPYCGHAAILGKLVRPWQHCDEVLRRFSEKAGPARRGYRRFVEKGIDTGKRPDLVGGGLIRSVGGWQAVRALRRTGMHQKSDERILGDSEFVSQVLDASREKMERRAGLDAEGFDLDALARRVGDLCDLSPADFLVPCKRRDLVRARSLFCYWAVRELGCTATALARRIGITPAAVSLSVARGRDIAESQDRLSIPSVCG